MLEYRFAVTIEVQSKQAGPKRYLVTAQDQEIAKTKAANRFYRDYPAVGAFDQLRVNVEEV